MKVKKSSKTLLISITLIFCFVNILVSSGVVFAKESYAANISAKAIKYLSGSIIAQGVNKELAATVPFEILSKSPDNDTEMVDTSSKIIVNFSEAVDRSSLNSTNFIVKNNEGNKISTAIAADSSNPAKVIITPISKLDFNKTYTVIVSKNVKSKSQASLGQDMSWGFKTIRQIKSLSVEPSIITVAKDKPQDVKVYAVYVDSPGNKEDVTAYANAKSSSESTATVNHGTITAIKVGKPTVTYSLGGKTTTLNIKTVPSLDHIAVSATKLPLEAGKSVSLKAIAYYSDKSSEDITSIANWVTGNEKAAAVSRGVISAKSDAQIGSSTTVNVLYLDNSIPIEVSIVKPVKKLTTNNAAVILPISGNKGIKLNAVFNDGSSANVEEEASAISSNPAVAKADGGIISAVSVGTAQITFTYGSQSTKISVTVKQELKSLVITPDTVSMETGGTANVKATATYVDNKTEDVTKYVDWSSSDSNSLSISQGAIYANAKSDSPIKITAVYGLQNKAATASVTITSAVRALSSDVQSSVAITKGQTLKVALIAKYVNISLPGEDVTDKVSKVSSNSKVASVSAEGITGVELGTSKITYSYGSKTLTIDVTVKPEPERIDVNASNVILEANGKAAVKVMAYYADNTTEDITKLVSYKLSDSKLVQVNQGVISSFGNEGDTELTINYGNKNPIKVNVKVLDSKEKVLNLDTNRMLKIEIGKTASPIVTAILSDKNWATVSTYCIWQSSNDKIVAIDPSTGTIQGLKEGTATITVNFCSQSAKINVMVTRP